MTIYNVREIAEMLNTNPETVRRWIRSGKLEAVRESRKEGNIVTKEMLDIFLKKSPKYAGIAANLLNKPMEVTMTTATLMGGLLIQQMIRSNNIENAYVKPEELKKMLLNNIYSSEETIKRKNANIDSLKKEIALEEQRINEISKLIEEIDLHCFLCRDERR